MILLNQSAIHNHLSTLFFPHPITIHQRQSIDSTNQFLKDLPKSHNIELCCTETQTNGRGRLGRPWYSPLAENIYCSIRLPATYSLSRLTGLSLVVSMAVIASLNQLGIHDTIQIKWPNDLLWNDQKLCGNLIEITTDQCIVIGIGLNVNSITQNHPLPDKPWCSLYDITQQTWDRNLLIATLLSQLDRHIQQLITQGMPSFLPTWHKLDYLLGRNISVSHHSQTLHGLALGIDMTGQLLLKDTSDVTHHLSSGDTTLQLSNQPG